MSNGIGDLAIGRSHVAAVTTREELVFLLSRASELEHGLACIYLFAAYSLKNDVSEGGLTDEQANMVRRWKRQLAHVAVEEMLHLAQVSNLLTAIGGAPRFKRANFPMPASAFPFGLRLTLEPFSRDTIDRFVCYEMPEPGILPPDHESSSVQIRERIVAADRRASAQSVGGVPLGLDAIDSGGASEAFEVDFRTVGEFYHKIRSGFVGIPEDELFIGPLQAQANARYVDLQGDLVAVVDTRSACAAIDMIIEQGEASTTAHPDAHFRIFDTIRKEYEDAVTLAETRGLRFEPVRPVVSNPMTRFYDDTSGGTVIKEPLTHDIADLFNVTYETMLLMLLRFFAHTEESEAELEHLSRATLRLMTTVIRPLGEALTKMPVDAVTLPGRTAGPGFGYNRDVELLPHKQSAWIFFGERLRQLALAATRLRVQQSGLTELGEASAALQDLAQQFVPAGRRWNSASELSEFRTIEGGSGRASIRPELNGPYLVANVDRLVNSRGEPLSTRPEMALCRCGGSANKPFCDGTHARIGFASHKLPGRVADRRDNYMAGRLTVHDNRSICQHAGFCTDHLPSVFRIGQEPFVDPDGAPMKAVIAQVRQCPSGALSYSIDDVEHRNQSRGPTITISKNGPYRITGGVALMGEARGEGASTEHYALCRCGGSKNKSFCDGTHWYNKFTDDKN